MSDDVLIEFNDLRLCGFYGSYISELPIEINAIITEFILGTDYSAGIIEAAETYEVLSANHEIFLCKHGLMKGQLPFQPKYYIDSHVDCNDFGYVDDEVVFTTTYLERTVFIKRLFSILLLSMVPVAEGSSNLFGNAYIDDLIMDFSDMIDCLARDYVAPYLGTIIIACIIILSIVIAPYIMNLVIWCLYSCFLVLQFSYRMVNKICYATISSLIHNITYIKRFFGSPRVEVHFEMQKAQVLSVRDTVSGRKYVFEANGVLYEGSMTEKTEQLEMSQKGSYLTYSNERPVGVIIAVDDCDNYTVVGGFFRIGDYLVTALHVAELIGSRAGNFEYAHFNKKISKIVLDTVNTVSVNKDHYDVSMNEIQEDMVDCFAVKMSLGFWSKVGVKACKFAHSYYEQPVTSTGIRDGVLVCATGLTQEHPDAWLLNHSATTEKGFSGFPIFHGKGVVGMHIIGGTKYNTCIRIELISQLLPQEESDSPFPYSTNFISGKRNINGKLEEIGDFFGFEVGIDASGRIQFKRGGKRLTFQVEDPEEIHDLPIGNMDVYFNQQAEHGLDEVPVQTLEQKFLSSDDIEDYGLPRPAPTPKSVVKQGEDTRVVPKQYGVRIFPDRLERMRVPKIRIPNPKMSSYLVNQATELYSLGFEDNKYSWPILTETAEQVSITKALELTSKRYEETPVKLREPSPRVRYLLAKMCQSLSYVAPIDVKDSNRLKDIMNSSYIKDSKSAGYPYCSEGLPNNESVFRHYGGVEGVTNITLAKWNDPLIGRVFNKGEPTKQDKINKGMLRTIYGFPIHKTVKNVSVFKEIADSAVENWCNGPIKYAYSPLIPRANHHLREFLDKGKEIWSSDKPNYDSTPQEKDYTYFSWLVQDLAQKHPDATYKQFEEYKRQVDATCREVCFGTFACSNGTHLELIQGGQTRSGWFMTILFNSIGQLTKHLEICLKLNMSNKRILETVIMVGGDDVVQLAIDGVTKEQYLKAAEEIGCPFDIEVSKDFSEGFEYFSHRIKPLGRSVVSIPVRFTKHIMNLYRATPGCEGDALISLMYEWIWCYEKYTYFYEIYMRFHIDDPDKYPLDVIPNPMVVQAHLNGEEVGTEVEKDSKRYGKLHRTLLERREMAIQCGVW